MSRWSATMKSAGTDTCRLTILPRGIVERIVAP
jgi:hypothetical protein